MSRQKLKPFQQWEDILLSLRKFHPYLSCLGYAGELSASHFLETELHHHEGLRICALGEMQRPSLAWRNGGIDLADLLHSIPQKV